MQPTAAVSVRTSRVRACPFAFSSGTPSKTESKANVSREPSVFCYSFWRIFFVEQAMKEIYAKDAERAKKMAAERKKNGTIEMSAAKIATMMDEAGGGEAGADVPMVKVLVLLSCIFTFW